jgi:hypothetical protein
MRRFATISAPALVLLTACALPPTGVQLGQQTAQDFNLDSRFGRNEIVMARVAPAERDEYALHHKLWGGTIRVADIELAGAKPNGDADIDVLVRVAWYRMEEQELRTSTLKQAWHSKSDSWQLMSEKRVEGDLGLLGEPVVLEAPAPRRTPQQFPTIRLGEGAATN